MTQKELAALLGITPSTITKAIKNAPDISQATRERVLRAMAEHGMKIEREQRTNGRAVLVVVSEFQSEYYAFTLSCLYHTLRMRGFDMLTMTREFTYDFEPLQRTLKTMRGICGVIVVDGGCPLPTARYPTVYCGSYFPELVGQNMIVIDYACGIREAMVHLISQKRRRIAFIGEGKTADKIRDFRQLIGKFFPDYDERYVYSSNFRFAQAGADGFSALFSLPEPPDAILCSYDYIALGVLNSAEAAGIDVPGELAVIGADDVRAAGTYRLGLSTIGIDHMRLAELLTELLLYRIEHPDAPPRRMELPSRLIVRGTG